MTVSNDGSEPYSLGTTKVVWTATDGSGNTATCSQVVTVEDNEDPTITCPSDVTVDTDPGECNYASSQLIAATAMDKCDTSVDVSYSPPSLVLGVSIVLWTATDDSGNTVTCIQNVLVVDNEDPEALCQDVTVQLNTIGSGTITISDINDGSNDACGVASLSLDQTDFSCSDVGPNTVILTVTDNNGNSSTCTANVTIEDNVLPTALCNDITVQLDANGMVTINTAEIDNGSSDACGVFNLELSDSDFNCNDVGSNSVLLTVSDNNGNNATCFSSVTVQDNIAPLASCNDITVQLDANGLTNISTSDIDNGSNDACSLNSLNLDETEFDCNDVGSNTVVLTVTDNNGNSSTCTANVDVEDNVDPEARCDDITIQLSTLGAASITTGDIDDGSSDACGISSLSLNETDFDCNDVGSNIVVLTVTDNNGNSSTCTANVEVEDNIDPEARCDDLTVQLNAFGAASITTGDINDGSSDVCGISSLSLNETDFDCGDVGSNTVVLTVTDNNGNSSTCTANVEVEDNVDPEAKCDDITVQLSALGEASITTGDIDDGSTDACGINILSLNETDFDCGDVGSNTVVLIVTDNNGNSSTCSANVEVEDNVDPEARCDDISIQLNTLGAASITTGDIDDGSSDACGISSLSLNETEFDCNDVGSNTAVLTVTDNNGNSSTCTANVEVEDNIDPEARCDDLTVQLNAFGAASITTGDINDGSSDVCGISSLSLNETDFDCNDVGSNTVVLTVTDNNNNSTTCTANVEVEDNVNPEARCDDITVQLSALGEASITTGDIDDGSSDACGISSLSLNETDFDCNDVGSNTVVLTVTDNNNNSTTCTANVEVEDNVNPEARCDDITVQLSVLGEASITTGDIDDGSSDACGLSSLSLNVTDFDCDDVGSNTVILTVTDNNNNSTTCTANVEVEDNIDPEARCDDLTIQLSALGEASITTGDINDGSSDVCGISSLSLDETDFDCSDVGSNTIVLTVTDNNGNSSTCRADVEVEDNVDPEARCADLTVQLNALGVTSISTGDIDDGSSDACGISSLSLDETDFDCGDVGSNTVILTVTDNNGNSSTCTAEVEVEDNVDPEARCDDLTVQLNAIGVTSITTGDIDDGSSDACGINSLSLDETDFDCSEVGDNTVVLTVTDNNGNSSKCTANVEVEDNIVPIAICEDVIVQLDVNGDGNITTGDIDNGSNDACGISSLSLDETEFNCTDIGTNTVILTVSDNNSNTATCSAIVTVEDNIAPMANCEDVTVQLDGNGDGSITTGDIDNGSNDACGINSLILDETDFDCSEVGDNTVVLTVTDNNGNSSTCTANVEVEDNIVPITICDDVTVQLDGNGDGSITTGDIDNGSNDACGINSLSLDETDFDCSEVGDNTVILTVTDNNGNSATCTANVEVEDNIIPIANCDDVTVQLDVNGDGSITTGDIDNGSNDACGINSLSLDETDFDCSEVGDNTVVLTVTDNNGNSSTCTANVEVEDNIVPITICDDVTVQLDGNGDGSITTGDIDNGSNDACGINSLSLDETDFDCSEVGDNTVVLTVTDNNGNSSTCSAIVTVEDNIVPITICDDVTVQLDGNGDGSITTGDIDNGSNDACGINSLSLDETDFDCSEVGDNTVILTVTDNNGNSATCTANVEVEDNIIPIANCEDVTVQLDVNGDGNITTGDIDNGSNDACGINSLSLDETEFNCTDIGNNTVILTVSDNNSNTATCSAIVTVEDNIAPMANCEDVTVQLDGNGDGSITTGDIDNGSNDACGINSLILDETDFDCSEVGDNTVVLTVTDNNGNSSTCTANVEVEDNIAPMANCEDVTVQLDVNGDGSITTGNIDNGSNDACGINSLSLDETDFDCSEVGDNIVILTVTDNNGNSSTCTANVEVEDNIIPIANCDDVTVQLDVNGDGSITTGDIDNGSNDACGINSLSLDETDFNCTNIGTNTVILTVSDNNSNTASCSAIATVEDNIVPMAICQDVTVQLDGNGDGSITTGDIDNGSNDACGINGVTLDNMDFDCSEVGDNTVVLTVTDNNGNSSTCTANVVVEDNIVPIAICQDVTVQLDINGDGNITTGDIDNGSKDACGISSLSLDETDFDCSEVGDNTVVFTVTDNNGNSTTCTANVEVEDNVTPIAICQDITIQLDINGDGNITTGDIDNGSNDACGISSLSLDETDFNCTEVGSNTVVLTVTDNNGNSSTCTAMVTVEDNIAPIAICEDVTVQLDVNGDGSITTSDIDNGSNDACGISSLVLDESNFDCSEVGGNKVVLTVTDNNGNSSTCTANVEVEDNIAPIAICEDVTIQLDVNGDGSITTSDIDNGSNDACGISSLILDESNFDCSEVGNNTIILTVSDNNSNTSTCSAIVTVEDNVAPTALCQDITVELDDSGSGIVTTDEIDAGSWDACGILLLDLTRSSKSVLPNQIPFNCSDLGSNTLILTVNDNNGNTSTCTSEVLVEDNIDPTITCPGDITIDTDSNSCSATNVMLGTAITDDNCTVVLIENNGTEPYDQGQTSIVWIVTDSSNNTSSCIQLINVEDNIPPTITCPDDLTVGTEPGECLSNLSDLGDALVDDNCEMYSVEYTPENPYLLGLNYVTWTITDVMGNTATCVQTIEVVDNESPEISCPDDLMVDTDPGLCTATVNVLGTPVTSDNCAVMNLTNSGSGQYNFGDTQVEWLVTDDAGNTNSCIQTISVEDHEHPIISCPDDLTITTNTGLCAATGVSLGNAITNDNCTVFDLTNDSTEPYDLGLNNIVWLVTDGSGNTNSCIQNITVEDHELPTITCPVNLTVNTDDALCSATNVTLGIPISNDNCNVDTVENDAAEPFVLTTTNVIWTVTDGNGNTSTCNQTVTVEDHEAPTIICPVDLTTTTDTGVCYATGIDLGMSIADDNCNVIAVVNDASEPYDLGSTIVSWIVTDDAGNTTSCNQSVTIIDPESPTITCPSDLTVTNDEDQCHATMVFLGSSITDDNCGVALIENDPEEPFNVGSTTIIWVVTDESGNTSTCSQNVVVEDHEAPEVTCPIGITVDTDSGLCTATNVNLGLGDFEDNCSISTIDDDLTEPVPLGVTIVEWIVTDNAGNISTCTQLLTVIDTEPPIISCPDDLTVDTDIDVCISTGVDIGISITSDNCTVDTVYNNSIEPYLIGTNLIIWTVEDGSGNSNNCTQNILVEDVQNPIITCPSDLTVNVDTGLCSASGIDLGLAVTDDNCGINSFENDSVEPYNEGMNIVVWTVYDDAGNSSTCSQSIDIIDNEPPMITCPLDLTVQANDDVCFADNVLLGSPVVTDNCFDFTVSNDAIEPYQLGSTDIIWTTTDSSNNTASCIQSIMVDDEENPEIICPADITIDANYQMCSAVNLDLGQVDSMDNCMVADVFNDLIEPVAQGSTDVIWTVTDASGNTATCVQNIFVNECVIAIDDCVETERDEVLIIDFIENDLNIPVSGTLSFTQPPNGEVIVTDPNNTPDDPSDDVMTYIPDDTFIGIDTFEYTLSDNFGNSSTALVKVTILFVDIALRKTEISSGPYSYGDIIEFNIEVFNQGLIDLVDIDIMDFVPCGLKFVSAENPDWTFNPITEIATTRITDSLYVNTSISVQIKLEIRPCNNPDGWGNIVEITGMSDFIGTDRSYDDIDSDPDEDPYNDVIVDNDIDNLDGDEDDHDIEVIDVFDLALYKTIVTPPLYHVGDTLEFAINVINQGNVAANNIVINDYLPVGYTIDPSLNIGWDINSAPLYKYTINHEILPGDTTKISIKTILLLTEDLLDEEYTNIAEISSAMDTIGNIRDDIDSTPDDITDNDIIKDDIVNNLDHDEDDHDIQLIDLLEEFVYPCEDDCDIQCNAIIHVSLDENCMAEITPAMGGIGIHERCNEYYSIAVYDENGIEVPDAIVNLSHIGQNMTFTITEPLCNNTCSGDLIVEYKLAPVINCPPDLSLTCAAFDLLEFPEATSACSPHVVELVDEQTEKFNCDPEFTFKISRTYRASDDYGNESFCSHDIYLKRLDFTQIVFPEPRTVVNGTALECNDPSMDYDMNGIPLPWSESSGVPGAGVPVLCDPAFNQGLQCPIDNSNTAVPLIPGQSQTICGANISYTDVELPRTSCVRSIIRTWEIREWWCGIENVTGAIQLIEIVDNSAPVFLCPFDITVETNGDCESNTELPTIIPTDNCSSTFEFGIDYPLGHLDTNGGNIVLELGANTISYTVYDECYNSASCQFNITVEDHREPVAICEPFTVVALENKSSTEVFAKTFDDGSWDDCGIDEFQVRRMDTTCMVSDTIFSDSVSFCCNDLDEDIMVVFRVIDLAGNTNDCIVRVDVQDKTVPTIECPDNVTIECGTDYDINNLNLSFGEIVIEDNCADTYDPIEIVNVDLNQCGIGMIQREFEVSSESGISPSPVHTKYPYS